MKAKVKSTGEIIDVYIARYGRFGNNPLEPIYKEVEWSEEGYREYALDFNDNIDWEERRFIAAKDILAAILSNSEKCMHQGTNEDLSQYAICMADELIKQLKKTKK